MWETQIPSLGQEAPLEKKMATHSSILDWQISWTEEPGRLQSMGLQRVGHDWVANGGYQAHMHSMLIYQDELLGQGIETLFRKRADPEDSS